MRTEVVFEDRWRVLSRHQVDIAVLDIAVHAAASEIQFLEGRISTAEEERWVELMCRHHHYREKIISILVSSKGKKSKVV